MPRVLIPIAEGFEDIEAITLIDVLRRAEVDVLVAGLEKRLRTSAHGVKITTDVVLADQKNEVFDAIILPGGLPGAQHLAESDDLMEILRAQAASGRICAAICAAPWALGVAGVLEGKTATCYPGFEDKLTGATHSTDRVVVDGNIITSRGPGTALEFALELVRVLVNTDTAATLRASMIIA